MAEVRSKVPPPPPPKKYSLKSASSRDKEELLPVEPRNGAADPYAVSSSESECDGPPPKIDIGRVDLDTLKTKLLVVKDGQERTATDLELVHAQSVKEKWERGDVETATVDPDGTAAARQAEVQQLRQTSLAQRFSVEEAEKQEPVQKQRSAEEEPEYKLASKARRKFHIIDAKVAKAAPEQHNRPAVVMKQHVVPDKTAASEESAATGGEAAGDAAHHIADGPTSERPAPAADPVAVAAGECEMQLRHRRLVTLTPADALAKQPPPPADFQPPVEPLPVPAAVLPPPPAADADALEQISWGARKMAAVKERGKRRKRIIKTKIKVLSYIFVALLCGLVVVMIIRLFVK